MKPIVNTCTWDYLETVFVYQSDLQIQWSVHVNTLKVLLTYAPHRTGPGELRWLSQWGRSRRGSNHIMGGYEQAGPQPAAVQGCRGQEPARHVWGPGQRSWPQLGQPWWQDEDSNHESRGDGEIVVLGSLFLWDLWVLVFWMCRSLVQICEMIQGLACKLCDTLSPSVCTVCVCVHVCMFVRVCVCITGQDYDAVKCEAFGRGLPPHPSPHYCRSLISMSKLIDLCSSVNIVRNSTWLATRLVVHT